MDPHSTLTILCGGIIPQKGPNPEFMFCGPEANACFAAASIVTNWS